MDSLAERWRELSGERNWEGLLDPLDINLCNYIIHYSERVEALSDAFNNVKASKGYGCSRYPMVDFFSKVGLEKGNPYKYNVTKFFYATVEFDWFGMGEPSWIGYVVVATNEGKAVLGRRDTLISWRGTMRTTEWISDVQFDLVPASDIFVGVTNIVPKVHHSWHSLCTSKPTVHLQ